MVACGASQTTISEESWFISTIMAERIGSRPILNQIYQTINYPIIVVLNILLDIITNFMLFLGTCLLYKLRCEGDFSLKLELSCSVLLQRCLDSNVRET